MTIVVTVGAPMMGLPKMDIPGMLARVIVLGWMAHFMVGTVLAFDHTSVQGRRWEAALAKCGLGKNGRGSPSPPAVPRPAMPRSIFVSLWIRLDTAWWSA